MNIHDSVVTSDWQHANAKYIYYDESFNIT